MKVLLISANTEQINMPVLPVGLASVAAAVQARGHLVELVNPMCDESPEAVVREAVTRFQPEIIGISVRNIDNQVVREPKFMLAPVQDMVAACRESSHAPIVLGGAGYTLFPDEVLSYLGADMGIEGEGEEAFVMLLDALSGVADLDRIPGLHRSGVAGAKARQLIRDLDRYSIPVRADQLCIPHDWNVSGLWVPVQTRRGCPMRCSYCSTAAIEGQITRKRSVIEVVESLKRAKTAGFRRVFFVDNTFNLPASYANALCCQIIAAGLTIAWRCIVYPWKMDEALVQTMATAGCAEVSLGFESGSEVVLKQLNKRFRPHEVSRISELFKKYAIRRTGFLLLGGPGETRKTVLESLRFAESLDLEALMITVGIRIYPHTRLAKIAVAEGIIGSERKLLKPTFYLSPALRDWLPAIVEQWLKAHPNWIY